MKKMKSNFVDIALTNVQGALNWFAHSPKQTFFFIFIPACAIRIQALMEIPSKYIVPSADWELGSIAISLMETGQFANPYMIPTGPTAHLPPIYPAIFSLIYRAFGLTSTAGYISMLFIVISASILYAILPWISKALGVGFQAGFLGGFAGALLIEWPGHGEYPTAIVLGLLIVAFYQRWTRGEYSVIQSLLLGLGIGISFHLQPALLPVFIGCMIFELWWSKYRNKWIFSIFLTLGILAACLPWGWRNYATFNAVFFIRSNLGLELRMGNHDGAYPSMEVMDANEEHIHPRTHFSEVLKLKEIGEIEYMRDAMNDAWEWIRTNPKDFVHLTSLRFLHVWFGPLHDLKRTIGISALTILAVLGLGYTWSRLTMPQRAVLLIPLFTYPLIYYIVAYMPRYRVPIDWILFMLAGSAIWHWIERNNKENVNA